MLTSYTVGPSLQNQRVPNCIIHTFDNCSTWAPTLISIWTSFHCLYTTHHYLSKKICYSFLGKIQMHVRSENCIQINSDSQKALKAFQAAQTKSPSVWQCQRTLDDISTHHSVGLFLSLQTSWTMWKMKMWMRSQERELFTSLLEWNQPWGSPGRI